MRYGAVSCTILYASKKKKKRKENQPSVEIWYKPGQFLPF